MRPREATPAIAEGLYTIVRLRSNMQTGTTPIPRTATEPPSDRSASGTGPRREASGPTARRRFVTEVAA